MRKIQTATILKSSKDKVKEGSDSSPLLFLEVLGGLHRSLLEVSQRCLSLFFTLSLKISFSRGWMVICDNSVSSEKYITILLVNHIYSTA